MVGPIQVSPSELAKREFVISYDVVRDRYTRPNDNSTGTGANDWASLLHQCENIQRNVEADHQMAYLCRQIGKQQGQLCWRVEHPGQTVRSVEAQLAGIATFHPDADVNATIQCGQGQEPVAFAPDGTLHLRNLGMADFTELRVQLAGGAGTYNEWQHSQLFRTSNQEANAQNLLLKIQFDETGLVKVQPIVPCQIDFQQEGFGKGFLPKRRLQIIGTPLDEDEKRISINLVEEGGQECRDANVPFHFNPRFAEKQVIRNNWNNQKGGWLAEERDGGFPFELGKPFVLELVAEEGNKIQCLVDNKHFCDFVRDDLSNVARLEISGAVALASVTLLSTPGILVQPLEEGPQLLKFADHNLKPGFLPPQRIQIVATGQEKGRKRVDVNLCSDGKAYTDGNVLLHFNIRFDENVVVRNSWHKDKGWGQEERDGGFPFRLSKQFALELVALAENKIRCLVDEQPFCEFTAREDLSQVSQILIEEAVEVKSISIQG